MAEFKDSYITEEERKALLIQNLADRPNAMSSYGRAKMSAEDLKKAFDDQFILVVDRHNLLHKIVEEIRGEAQTERLESLENRADTVDERLGDPNDANSIEDVIQRVASLENLLDDPDEQDTLNESYKGVRARVKTNENNILNNAGAISENAKAISENNANIAGHEGRLESLEIAMGNHYNMILTNNQNISTLSDKVQTDSQGIETNAQKIQKNAEQIGYINTYLDRDPSDSANIFFDVYPVGSIYMSVNSTSPASLFGGTWTPLKDRFLVGAGSAYSGGATGGETSHSHNGGSLTALMAEDGNSTNIYHVATRNHYNNDGVYTSWNTTRALTLAGSSGKTTYRYQGLIVDGKTGTTTTLPPCLAGYMWKRTAYERR